MPKKSKKTKEPKKATKKIKQTVKQSVKQSVVIKIGDTSKKKRTYTRKTKQGPAVKAPAPERQSTSLQPTIYQAPVQPISRLDPNNQAVQASIQQFDKMSQSLNETLQKLNNPNLLKRTIELEGEQGGLVPTERQTLPEQPAPTFLNKLRTKMESMVEEEPEQTPIRTYQPPSLFNQPTTQQPEVSQLPSGTITGTITPTAPNEMTEDEYNKIVSEMKRMEKLQVQVPLPRQPKKIQQEQQPLLEEPDKALNESIMKQKKIKKIQQEQQPLLEEPDISSGFQETSALQGAVSLVPTGQFNEAPSLIKAEGVGAEEQLVGLETIKLEGGAAEDETTRIVTKGAPTTAQRESADLEFRVKYGLPERQLLWEKPYTQKQMKDYEARIEKEEKDIAKQKEAQQKAKEAQQKAKEAKSKKK